MFFLIRVLMKRSFHGTSIKSGTIKSYITPKSLLSHYFQILRLNTLSWYKVTIFDLSIDSCIW